MLLPALLTFTSMSPSSDPPAVIDLSNAIGHSSSRRALGHLSAKAPKFVTWDPSPQWEAPALPAVREIASLSELRARVANASAAASDVLVFRLPEGARFYMNGTQIQLTGISLTLISDGAGATFDAEYRGRCFTVDGGGHLELRNVHLTNGSSELLAQAALMMGGLINVWGGSITLVGATLSNAFAPDLGGGAMIIWPGIYHIINSTFVVS